MSYQDDEDWKLDWKNIDPLTVRQAAALIAGYDPNYVQYDQDGKPDHFRNEANWTEVQGIGRVKAHFAGLTQAIRYGRLKAHLVHDAEPRYFEAMDRLHDAVYWRRDENIDLVKAESGEEYLITPTPNWEMTVIDRSDLEEWLKSRGVRDGFFFPEVTDDASGPEQIPDYLNPDNPRYSPKLAAAIKAWQAMPVDPSPTPRKAIEAWLRDHAKELGLLKGDGTPNNTGIEEIAKVANWKYQGTAKTPG